MNRIFITGDTHGDYDIEKLKQLKSQKLTKDDYLIILGDWGCVWSGDRRDEYWINWYNEKPYTTLFIDGNHENHRALAQYPVEEWNGGKVHRIADSVFHLMRGEYFEIGGHTFFTFGGGKSHDMIFRVEGRSWWPEEMPTKEEMQHGLDVLEEHDAEVEYILTHEPPALIADMYGFSRNDLNTFFDRFDTVFGVSFKSWCFGHYHRDISIDKYHGFYNKVLEVGVSI